MCWLTFQALDLLLRNNIGEKAFQPGNHQGANHQGANLQGANYQGPNHQGPNDQGANYQANQWMIQITNRLDAIEAIVITILDDVKELLATKNAKPSKKRKLDESLAQLKPEIVEEAHQTPEVVDSE